MKKTLSTSLSAGAVAAIIGFGYGAAAETYQAAMWLPPSHPLTQPSYPDFAEKVAADSGGAIEFEVYIC